MTLRQSAVCGWLFACIALCVYGWTLYQMEMQSQSEGFQQTLRMGLYGITFFYVASVGAGYQRLQQFRLDCQAQTLDWGQVLHNKAMLVFNKRKSSLTFYALASGGLLVAMYLFAHRLSQHWQWMVMYTVGVLWVHCLVICFIIWKRLYSTQQWLELENQREAQAQ